jgi:hypothetical protein
MGTEISASTTTIVTSKGEKTYYSFDVVDPKTGQIKESFNTTDPTDAKAKFEEIKGKYPSSLVNGKNTDPFEDGTFKSQADYEVGGFAGPASEAGSDGQFNQDDIRNLPTPGSSPYEEGAALQNTSKFSKEARDRSGISKREKRKYKSFFIKEDVDYGKPTVQGARQLFQKKLLGVAGQKRIQAQVPREKLSSEKEIGPGPDNNAFIVIGNDRVDLASTGYGGKGHTQCDAIDIVAGMGGPSPREEDSKGKKKKQNPSFFQDAARIYISQKTDVDKNFGIGEFGRAAPEVYGVERAGEANLIGVYGAKSAVAVKADNVRLIGRESIRIVTGTDAKNSQGGDVLAKSGIELIANNDIGSLQPIVLGDNLQLGLITILNNVEALAKIMHGYIKYQMKYNQALQQHTHVSPFYGITTLASEPAVIAGIKCDIETGANTELSILKHITNLQGVKHNFLTDSGESFINSRNNKVN